MDPEFWHDRWRRGEIGFHQREFNDLLVSHWPRLGIDPQSKVFVPLAGKSQDMAWLAARGHRVVANELSEFAVDAFLCAQGLTPAEAYRGLFVVKYAGPYELWVGDYFALPRDAFRDVAAVWDRAALIAMPRTLQRLYAEKLSALLSPGTRVLLTSISYDPSEMGGPPFPVDSEQVDVLLSPHFDVELLERRDGMPRSQNLKARGLSWLEESVYLATRKET